MSPDRARRECGNVFLTMWIVAAKVQDAAT
jgi:hypothetical protein